MASMSHATGYPDFVVAALADHIEVSRRDRQQALRVGISGLQGSGKSTLARQLTAALVQRGVATTHVSLDDFYLTHNERLRLAREVHPLLATRGVPGTHDYVWLANTLDDLSSASTRRPVVVPYFDKASDDRALPDRWQTVDAATQAILFEGWCVGVPAQPDATLIEPINTLERDEDSDGIWRRWVNAVLREHYEPLWHSLDALIVLQAPSFELVKSWRGESENLRREQGADNAMSDDQLARFIAHYERLSRHSLVTLPAIASHLLRLDAGRKVLAIESAREGSTENTKPR